MQKAIVRRTFDVVRNQRQEPIYAAKGDYGARYIQAIITVDGVPYAIPENAIVTINAFRRDGKTNRFKGEVNADGSVIVPITQWMLEILGMVDCTISAVEEGGMLTTENFYVVANESSTNVEVSTDDPQYDLLTEVLLNEGTRQKQFSDMVEYINSLEQGKQGPAGPAGIHIGAEAPTDGQVVWIDINEEPSEEEGGANFDITAKPGQVIAVKAVDANGKPLTYKAVDLPVHDAPDWNASEGEAGHVANRTHFVDASGVVHKLNNKYIDADWMATSEDYTAVETIIPEQKVTSTWSNLQYNLQPGIEYDVIINDAVYPCVAWGSGAVQLGNNTSLSKNDYPFCVFWAGGTANGGMFFYDSDVFSSPIYLKVTEHAYTKYNTLPDEFLPKSVVKTVNGAKPDEKGNVQIETGGGSASIDVTAQVGQTIRVTEVDADGKPTKWEAADYQPRTHWSEYVEVLPETTCEVIEDIGAAMLPDMSISAGDNLTVVYNGTEYNCTCVDMGEGMLAFGNYGVMDEENPVDTGEPFAAVKTDSGDGTLVWVCVPLDGSAKFTLAIVGEAHHTIDEKFLPVLEIPKIVLIEARRGDIQEGLVPIIPTDYRIEDIFKLSSTPNTIVRILLKDGATYASKGVVLNLHSIVSNEVVFSAFEQTEETGRYVMIAAKVYISQLEDGTFHSNYSEKTMYVNK